MGLLGDFLMGVAAGALESSTEKSQFDYERQLYNQITSACEDYSVSQTGENFTKIQNAINRFGDYAYKMNIWEANNHYSSYRTPDFRDFDIIIEKFNEGINELKSRLIGEQVELGEIDDLPITWTAIDVDYSTRSVLVISNEILFGYIYATEPSPTWETSLLRKYLNTTFYDKIFTSYEKTGIVDSRVVTKNNPQYGTYGGDETIDKIFILSAHEAAQYFDSDRDRTTNFLYKNNVPWILRTPGKNSEYISYVTDCGRIDVDGLKAVKALYPIRPAMRVKMVQK